MTTLAPTSRFSRRLAFGLGSGVLLTLLSGSGRSAVAAHDDATLEAHKALARRVFMEAINQRSTAAVAELIALDHVDYGGAMRQMPGPAGMPLTIDEFDALTPRLFAMVDDTVAEGDLVALRVTWRADHPPAGSHLVGRTMHMFRIAQGQIAAGWSVGWEWLDRLSDGPRRRPGNPLLG